ncbi:alpha/beta fold hydrolase [Kytococcus sedentarius]|uniref:alpha/beta fold hydrolase n=1 Tax=Kytococcus sedentarius TaxID=1276 RepID=UPI0035BC4C76
MTTGPRLLSGPDGPLEVLETGSGSPTTVFGHGLAGTIDTTRPFATGVRGSKVFLHFRGHGRSLAPEVASAGSDGGEPRPGAPGRQAPAWGYASLAADLRRVADEFGATRALGVSMGAGALTRILSEEPDRFERVVLVIPAVIDRVREDRALDRMAAMARLVEAGDVDALAASLLAEQPPQVQADRHVQVWCAQQARQLVGTPVGTALRALPHEYPIADRGLLARVEAPVLVIGQVEDDAHPAHIAEELGEALGNATVEILPPGGLMWSHRTRVRSLVADFLND